jgi:DNA-binding response OmpR family regulator
MVKKVLFINNAGRASVIPELLADTGCEISEVFDAGAGLRRLESRPFDMVILVENAAAESWLLCGKIRRLTTSPFITISSGASAETCVKAIASGADFFIRKPCGPMELLARVNALFQRVNSSQPVPMVS